MELDPVSLDRAWMRVLADAYTDAIPDVLRWEDHKIAWASWRADLEESLKDGSYSPSTPVVVEVPKDAFATRPVAMLRPQDRVVYEALVDRLAPIIDPLLPESVYSARIRRVDGERLQIRRQVRQWLRFQDAGRRLYDEFDYAYLLTTDVTSYFEYVDIRTLLQDLRSVDGVDSAVVELLGAILNKFEGSSNVWGIPQGLEGSGVLGNFYLLPIDRVLQQHGAKFIRFQDDIKVFADNPRTLRALYGQMVGVLRSRRLNFSVHKTKLLGGPPILDEFEDDRKRAIEYGLKVDAPDVGDRLRRLFDDAIGQMPPPARDVRFAVYRLARRGDPYAIEWVLAHLQDVPYLAELLVDYLSVHYDEVPGVESSVLAFLQDPDRNTSPFVELQLLRMFSKAPRLGDEARDLVWRTIRDQNKEGYVREHAIRCVGRHARPGDAQVLHSYLMRASDLNLRRAFLVGMKEAGIDASVLATIGGREPLLAHTCAYLRKTTKLPPP